MAYELTDVSDKIHFCFWPKYFMMNRNIISHFPCSYKKHIISWVYHVCFCVYKCQMTHKSQTIFASLFYSHSYELCSYYDGGLDCVWSCVWTCYRQIYRYWNYPRQSAVATRGLVSVGLDSLYFVEGGEKWVTKNKPFWYVNKARTNSSSALAYKF